MRILLIVAALSIVAFAGCVDEAPNDTLDSDGDGVTDAQEILQGTDPLVAEQQAAAPYAQVVVAVIDSGVNVYHDYYQRAQPVPNNVVGSFVNSLDQKAPRQIQLTTAGTYEERLTADQAIWDNISHGELVHFAGTNVLGISFTVPEDGFADDREENPILDEGGHGTGTTSSVLGANSDAIIVLVEGAGNAAGEVWVAEQSWIDLMSLSYGYPGSLPLGRAVFDEGTYEATRAAWDAGKIPFGASDNSPATSAQDETSGPPWVIGIAGDHPDVQCREGASGNLPDFTADFTQELPRYQTIDEFGFTSGTSFATPTSAGVASGAIQGVRAAWGHEGGITDGALAVHADGTTLTNWGVRDALNTTAVYFTESTPGCGTGESSSPDDAVFDGGTRQPVNPESPWQQMGWGHLGPEIIAPTVAHLLGTEVTPAKPDQAVQYQEGVYEAREEYWADN
jgi:hypothetical protein